MGQRVDRPVEAVFSTLSYQRPSLRAGLASGLLQSDGELGGIWFPQARCFTVNALAQGKHLQLLMLVSLVQESNAYGNDLPASR